MPSCADWIVGVTCFQSGQVFFALFVQALSGALLTKMFYQSRMKSHSFYSSKMLLRRSLTMEIKLFDSELKIMDVLWKNGDTTAKRIAEILKEQVGWNKTTTYTLIKRCMDKGAIERVEPHFVCRPLVTIEQARELETTELINKMYDGAADQLVASILGRKNLSPEEIERLKRLVNRLE
jgi:predicted transcriptional regulator